MSLRTWIKETGHKRLRADSWSDVAILCPRKLWLRTMATALRRLDLPVTVQSESDLNGDNPAYAWLTGLCAIMIDPRNSYEIVGVLREVFGVADDDLATFSEGDGNRFRIDAGFSGTGIVSTPLHLLSGIRQRMQSLALFDAIKLLIEETQLRKKLASLPIEDYSDLEDELDTLLTLAAEEEASGATLADFAEKLRLDFLLQRNVRRSTGDGIQLITAQKAKGSEWQAVILPFLGRNVIPPWPRYPCVIKIPESNESLVALTKDDFPEEVRSATKTAVQQEMARLLYVAATRARHTLVLAMDEEIFARSNGEMQTGAQLKCLLGENEMNRPHFETLGLEPTPGPEKTDSKQNSAEAPRIVMPAFEPLNGKEVKLAKTRALNFMRKFNPSGYDEENIVPLSAKDASPSRSSSTITRSTADTPATLYGRWWHDFMQQISWRDEKSWPQTFEVHQPRSPVSARSAKEWALFRNSIKNDPVLMALLTGQEWVAHSEMPFAWRADESNALEGVVDLALFSASEKRCFILDWKTDRISAAELAGIKTRYRPQLAAYWQALTAMTGFSVDAGIYSTAAGEFVTYHATELAQEWERLRAQLYQKPSAN